MRKIINLFLIIVLFLLCGFYIWKYTPISANYYFSKGKQLYSAEMYQKAAEMFEKASKVNPNEESYAYFFVASLIKVEPDYFVQEKLYNISRSPKYSETVKNLAKSHLALLKKKFLEGFDDNYIYNAISTNEIVHWNIEDFPLKVFIPKNSDVPKYYIEDIISALREWEKRTGFITFELVNSEKESNILISFQELPKSNCNENGCPYMVASTEQNAATNGKLERMVINFYKTNPFGEPFTSEEINYTALHELGHALGIMGHSDNKTDIMYSNNQKIYDAYSAYRPKILNISLRDLKTITLLYKIYPTMTNSRIINQSKYLYAPLILGADDSILQSKLQEYEHYIHQYPNVSTGYINLSSVYSQLGEYQNAINELEKAEKLASSDDELFLIEYNRAMIYFNMQKFSESKQHAHKALSVRNDKNIHELLNELDRISSEL